MLHIRRKKKPPQIDALTVRNIVSEEIHNANEAKSKQAKEEEKKKAIRRRINSLSNSKRNKLFRYLKNRGQGNDK